MLFISVPETIKLPLSTGEIICVLIDVPINSKLPGSKVILSASVITGKINISSG